MDDILQKTFSNAYPHKKISGLKSNSTHKDSNDNKLVLCHWRGAKPLTKPMMTRPDFSNLHRFLYFAPADTAYCVIHTRFPLQVPEIATEARRAGRILKLGFL